MARKSKKSITVVEQKVEIGCAGNQRATIEIFGTFSGTIVFEAKGHPDGAMQAISGIPMDGGSAGTSTTAPDTFMFDVRAITALQARCSVFGSGTIEVLVYAE